MMIAAPDGLIAYFGEEGDRPNWVSVPVTAFSRDGEALYVHLGRGRLEKVTEFDNFRCLDWE